MDQSKFQEPGIAGREAIENGVQTIRAMPGGPFREIQTTPPVVSKENHRRWNNTDLLFLVLLIGGFVSSLLGPGFSFGGESDMNLAGAFLVNGFWIQGGFYRTLWSDFRNTAQAPEDNKFQKHFWNVYDMINEKILDIFRRPIKGVGPKKKFFSLSNNAPNYQGSRLIYVKAEMVFGNRRVVKWRFSEHRTGQEIAKVTFTLPWLLDKDFIISYDITPHPGWHWGWFESLDRLVFNALYPDSRPSIPLIEGGRDGYAKAVAHPHPRLLAQLPDDLKRPSGLPNFLGTEVLRRAVHTELRNVLTPIPGKGSSYGTEGSFHVPDPSRGGFYDLDAKFKSGGQDSFKIEIGRGKNLPMASSVIGLPNLDLAMPITVQDPRKAGDADTHTLSLITRALIDKLLTWRVVTLSKATRFSRASNLSALLMAVGSWP